MMIDRAMAPCGLQVTRAASAILAAAMGITAAGCSASVPFVPPGAPASVHFPATYDHAYSVSTFAAASKSTPCDLPCDLSVPSGTQSFTFARKDKPDAVFVSGVIPPAGAEVTFRRQNRGLLITGAVLSLVGLGLGFPLAVDTAGPADSSGGVSSTDLTLGVVGLGALAVGTVLMLVSGSDSAVVRPASADHAVPTPQGLHF
jgi:hypothetical protein